VTKMSSENFEQFLLRESNVNFHVVNLPKELVLSSLPPNDNDHPKKAGGLFTVEFDSH
jgi:hypothetical protein